MVALKNQKKKLCHEPSAPHMEGQGLPLCYQESKHPPLAALASQRQGWGCQVSAKPRDYEGYEVHETLVMTVSKSKLATHPASCRRR